MNNSPLFGWPLKEKGFTREEVKGWSRARKFSVFANGAARLDKALRKFPKKMWGFTADPKNWNIIQVLWHLTDQEANLYVRFRRAAAEPGQPISAYDQEKWDAKLFYKKADPEQARILLKLLRQANTDLLKRMPSSAWKNKVKHPEWGSLSVEFLVGLNVWHLDGHLAQMGRRFLEWKARGK